MAGKAKEKEHPKQVLPDAVCEIENLFGVLIRSKTIPVKKRPGSALYHACRCLYCKIQDRPPDQFPLPVSAALPADGFYHPYCSCGPGSSQDQPKDQVQCPDLPVMAPLLGHMGQ